MESIFNNPNEAISKPSDLNEWAYSVIKTKILNGQIKSGSQLRIEELSSELQISRTPIREALLRLVRDNLIFVKSRVGFFVREISQKEIFDLFELRRIIESYAAEYAAKHFNSAQINEICSIHEQSCLAIAKADYLKFDAYDTNLHNYLIVVLNNHIITNALNNVADCLFRQRIQALEKIDHINKAIQEHELIVNAISERNSQMARYFMDKHISSVFSRIMRDVKFKEF